MITAAVVDEIQLEETSAESQSHTPEMSRCAGRLSPQRCDPVEDDGDWCGGGIANGHADHETLAVRGDVVAHSPFWLMWVSNSALGTDVRNVDAACTETDMSFRSAGT